MNGPPISIAIIPATTIPKRTLLVPPIEFNTFVIPVLIVPKNGFTNNKIAPTKPIPNKGYNNVGFNPSKDCGKKLNTFLIPSTRYPAKNPANKAPKNPPLTTDILESNALAMVIPEFANAPPTKPAANPGLSAILIDIYPAKIGNIKLNDVSPIVLRTAANGVFFPKLAGFIL